MTKLPPATSGRSALDVLKLAACEGGQILRERFHGEKRIEQKGRGNVVTDADVEVEGHLKALFRREYPDFAILSEEAGADSSSSSYTWLIDPLDGTLNFSRSLPHFSVVVALARGKQALLGAVYDAVRDELFHAAKGQGAFLNDQPVTVSQRQTLRECVIGWDMGYSDEKGRKALEAVLGIWPGVQTCRIMGSSALGLAYLACGRIDLYFHPCLYPWEIGAGKLLVEEAGGIITDWSGRPVGLDSSDVIAAGRAVHGDFRRLAPSLTSS